MNKLEIISKFKFSKSIKNLTFFKIFIAMLFFQITLNSKDFDLKSFICADEIGPIFEFSIPDMSKNLDIENFSLKIYNKENRNLFYVDNSKIKKKSSPIDRSYFFYSVIFSSKEKGSEDGYFEFFPPSHLMLKKHGSQFSSLVCWQP